jgi:hypothetical protein
MVVRVLANHRGTESTEGKSYRRRTESKGRSREREQLLANSGGQLNNGHFNRSTEEFMTLVKCVAKWGTSLLLGSGMLVSGATTNIIGYGQIDESLKR